MTSNAVDYNLKHNIMHYSETIFGASE